MPSLTAGVRHFSWHTWDGEKLDLGIAPQISPIDYVGQAVRQLRSPGFDFERVIYGETDIDYALAWGLVSFLIKEHPQKFQIWRTALNHEVEPKVAWQKQFGGVTPDFVKSFETWLNQHSQPWRVYEGQWQPWGIHVEGQPLGPRPAQMVLLRVPVRLTTEFAVESNAVQGITFGFLGTRDFHVLERHSDRWEIARLPQNAATGTNRQTFPASGRDAKTVLESTTEGTVLKFDAHKVEMTNVVGRLGLWVQRGKARFRCNWE